jgi:hypothetical protein
MATIGGANTVTDGLVLYLDGNQQLSKYRQNYSLINTRTWTIGSGSVTNFTQNGITSENIRQLGTDPFGNNTVLWTSTTDSASDADGGWNGAFFSVTSSATYRFSVWLKRNVLVVNDGYSYLGTRGFPQNATGYVTTLAGVTSSNPYFYSNRLNTSDWRLFVGHVHSSSYAGSTHTDSGVYNTSGSKVASCTDYKMQSGSTSLLHRSYLYYATNTSSQQYFLYPRVDRLDGTEPSISDLIQNSPNKWDSSLNNGTSFNFINDPVRRSDFGGGIEFNGSTTSAHYIYPTTDLNGNVPLSVEGVFLRTGSFSQGGPWGIGGNSTLAGINCWNSTATNQITIDLWGTTTYSTGQEYPLNKPIHIIWVYRGTSFVDTNISIFVNGVEYTGASLTNLRGTSATPNLNTSTQGISLGRINVNQNQYFAPMAIYNFKVYNKALSNQESIQNWNSIRTRFGL